MRELNYRQRLFVMYFAGECNGDGPAAARKAGYSNPETAARKLMMTPAVRRHIGMELGAFGMSVNEIAARYSEIGSFDIGEIFKVGPDGNPGSLDLNRARRLEKTGVIKKLKITCKSRNPPGGDYAGEPVWITNIEVELYDKLAALQALARMYGLNNDKLDVNTTNDTVQTVFYMPSNGRDPHLATPIPDPDDPSAAEAGAIPGE